MEGLRRARCCSLSPPGVAVPSFASSTMQAGRAWCCLFVLAYQHTRGRVPRSVTALPTQPQHACCALSLGHQVLLALHAIRYPGYNTNSTGLL